MKLKSLVAAAMLSATFLGSATAALADKFQDILDNGTVRIAIALDMAPWGSVSGEGHNTGIDVELAQLLAADLGVELEIVPVSSASRIPTLMADKADLVIAGLGATSERAQQVMFSQPYVAVQLGVFGAKALDDVTDSAGFDGKTIAVVKGSGLDIWLTDNAPGANLLRFEDVSAAIAAYVAGQAEMVAENSAIVHAAAQSTPGTEFDLKYTVRQSPAHVGVPMGEHNLLQWVNTFIFTNKMNGKVGEMQVKYFGERQDSLPGL